MKNLIQEKLDYRKKNQAWLALKTGLSKVYINKLIKNKNSKPKITTAHKIARALDCTIEELWILD